jgi:hypothetical protein
VLRSYHQVLFTLVPKTERLIECPIEVRVIEDHLTRELRITSEICSERET